MGPKTDWITARLDQGPIEETVAIGWLAQRLFRGAPASMKKLSQFVINTLIGGLLIVLPIYLAVLLMMKAMASVANLLRPLSRLVPDWLPAEKLLSLLLVLLVCFLIG